MSKFAHVKLIGTVALALVVPMTSALAYDPDSRIKPVAMHPAPAFDPGPESPRVITTRLMFLAAGPDLADAYMALSQVERARLLVLLTDERTMRRLAVVRAHEPTGPIDAR